MIDHPGLGATTRVALTAYLHDLGKLAPQIGVQVCSAGLQVKSLNNRLKDQKGGNGLDVAFLAAGWGSTRTKGSVSVRLRKKAQGWPSRWLTVPDIRRQKPLIDSTLEGL